MQVTSSGSGGLVYVFTVISQDTSELYSSLNTGVAFTWRMKPEHWFQPGTSLSEAFPAHTACQQILNGCKFSVFTIDTRL